MRIATMDMPSRTVYSIRASGLGEPRVVHAGGLQIVPGWHPRGAGDDDEG